ncbi:hypothetical protein N9E25_13355 [Verrucomicrobiales bacterium]|nr:hypothetical protein [Verrucomicrobiales bacterium]
MDHPDTSARKVRFDDTVFALLLVQFFATSAMGGIIWFVQMVTYPQFAEIPASKFISYHLNYSHQITWVVAPLMVIELFTGCAFASVLWRTSLRMPGLIGAIFAIATWGITGLIQVPQHGVLSLGKDLETINALVACNWIRVCLWSARSLLVGWIIFVLFRKNALVELSK